MLVAVVVVAGRLDVEVDADRDVWALVIAAQEANEVQERQLEFSNGQSCNHGRF